MPAVTTTPLDLQQIKDAFIAWVESEKPDCCEIDELICFIEDNEPEYPQIEEAIETVKEYAPEVLYDSDGVRVISHTSKTLAAKHFQMAQKLRPVVWEDYAPKELVSNSFDVNLSDKGSALKLIAMLLTRLEAIYVEESN